MMRAAFPRVTQTAARMPLMTRVQATIRRPTSRADADIHGGISRGGNCLRWAGPAWRSAR